MDLYIGYRQNDYQLPFAHFFNEKVLPAPQGPMDGLQRSPFPQGALRSLNQVREMLADGYNEVENGYTVEADGSLRIAVLTPMPGVDPAMWNWWFAWHSDAANKYKLWHPLAHRDARWKDGKGYTGQYIGRTSLIEEYIGKKLEKASIRFVDPTLLGFPPEAAADKHKMTLICARLGYAHYPLDFGWLVHQVRATPEGAEMRSRFWIGGPHIELRLKGAVSRWISGALQKLSPVTEQQAQDLLTHCAEEMPHLAAFLPAIYQLNHP
ncbi:MAG: hypothetical protein JNJ57_12735 [Saprospiraceae bacterium]|nr:hypothetical protein [Saprospiraceae bacterium]